MSRSEKVLLDLREAGEETRRALEARRVASSNLEAAVKKAVKAGIPKTEIAEAAGINRVTVYKVLDRF